MKSTCEKHISNNGKIDLQDRFQFRIKPSTFLCFSWLFSLNNNIWILFHELFSSFNRAQISKPNAKFITNDTISGCEQAIIPWDRQRSLYMLADSFWWFVSVRLFCCCCSFCSWHLMHSVFARLLWNFAKFPLCLIDVYLGRFVQSARSIHRSLFAFSYYNIFCIDSVLVENRRRRRRSANTEKTHTTYTSSEWEV